MPGADTPALPTRPCAMLPVLTEGRGWTCLRLIQTWNPRAR